jgi:flagellar motor switch protein FliG
MANGRLKSLLTNGDEHLRVQLHGLSGQDIARCPCIKNGSPATIATLIKILKPPVAALVLSSLSRERQIAALLAAKHPVTVDWSTMVALMETVIEEVKTIHLSNGHPLGGSQFVANVLSQWQHQDAAALIRDIKSQDPSTGETIEGQMWSPERLLNVDQIELQRALGQMSDLEVCLVLLDSSLGVSEYVLNQVSHARKDSILELQANRPKTPKEDWKKAIGKIRVLTQSKS